VLLSLKSDQIMEGMLLGQDIMNDDGVLLMQEGRVLQSHDLFWINSIFGGYEILVEETRLKRGLFITKDIIIRGVKHSLKQSTNLESMYVMLSILNDSIGGYFTKLYPQLIDLGKSDPITFEHSLHVTWYSLFLGMLLNLSEEEMILILQAAVLHDIGKSFIPSTVLTKKGKLTAEEFGMIKKHPEYGEAWAKQFTSRRVSSMIRNHHEYLNGKGYPDGLKGDQLDQVAHIITVADIFDAVSSKRSYRDGMSPFKAYNILMEESAQGRIKYEYVVLFVKVLDCLAGEEVFIGNGMSGIFKEVISTNEAEVIIQGRSVKADLSMIELPKEVVHDSVVDL
jgi:HD-GYP domain-containing protein (c-di-GMP phosphodiesterase class II)